MLVSGTGGKISNIMELKGAKENFKGLLMCLHSRTSHYPLENFDDSFLNLLEFSEKTLTYLSENVVKEYLRRVRGDDFLLPQDPKPTSRKNRGV